MVKTNRIKDKIYQIKVIDTEATHFHGCIFPTREGASYNCYLVVDEQITLIDVIDTMYFDLVLKEIKNIIGDQDIDNIIINHVEPDHSGGYEMLKRVYPNAASYTSATGKRAMQHQFFGDHTYTKVATKDTLNIGEYTLSFFETPLVHWPDNMWTYIECEQMLFTNDAFGQLIVDDAVYDNEVGVEKVLDFSREYYANILLPGNVSVKSSLLRFLDLGWTVRKVLPSHGVIVRTHINEMFAQYRDFVNVKLKKKAVIVYETVWGSSRKMANVYADKLSEKGYEVKVYQLSESRISEVITELSDAELIVVGTGNYNNCLLPTVADFMERLKAAKLANRKALVFGSYGWAKVHLKRVQERLEEANIEVLADPFYVMYVPDDESITLLESQIDGMTL